MALYTRDSRDRVRDAVDFQELVAARTELRRAGPARYEGLCPFHDERTPSFGIDPVQKVYYCFGCQASGDVFTFVQETEGVDFKEALELLADRYAVELHRDREDPREQERRRRRERLLELLARTAAYYERYLWESEEAARARDYLAGRGLAEQVLREFRVGYAPSAWDRVLLASRRGGFSEQELYATGLAQRSRQTGQAYDRFRARITFPLADMRGRVLGFGARSLDDDAGPTGAVASVAGSAASGAGSDQARGRRPKYLNTADNDVYHKGMHLYGADLARAHAARAGQAILCEGYTDVIALHQAGMRNAVGVMGTALTSDQVGELSRMAQTVLLALDADTAGQEAMLRASALARRRNLELRVVPLPAGMDPAELIHRDGGQAMIAAIDAAIPFVRFRVERALEAGDERTPEGRDRTIAELRPVFATLPPSAMRLELMRTVSSRLDLPDSLAEQLLAHDPRSAARAHASPADPDVRGSARTAHGGSVEDVWHAGGGVRTGAGAGGRGDSAGAAVPGTTAAAARRTRALTQAEQTERAFLALCLAAPEAGGRALAELEVEEHFSGELVRRAVRHLLAAGLATPMRDAPGGEDLDRDPELKRLLAEIVVEAGRADVRPAMLEAQRLQLELARLERQIRRARGNEHVDVGDLAKRRGVIKRELDTAVGRVLEETGARE